MPVSFTIFSNNSNTLSEMNPAPIKNIGAFEFLIISIESSISFLGIL